MNAIAIKLHETPAINRFFLSIKKYFRKNREVPLRYCLLISPILLSVLVVGFIRYFYGRLMHQY